MLSKSTFTLVAFALCAMANVSQAYTYPGAKAKFCKKEFAPNDKRCAIFHFPKTSGERPCVNPKNGTTFFDISMLPHTTISESSKLKAQYINSVFENGEVVFDYPYVENIHDGRGYTVGSIGFTTGTNDAWAVVKAYNKERAKHGLKKFSKTLSRLSSLSFCNKNRADTSSLKGFPEAWKTAACKDEKFRKVQDAFTNTMYFEPSLRFSALAGLKTDLGKAIFYDTIINHGWQYTEPYINIWYIIALTGKREHNEDEKSYLLRFLDTRRQLMCCANDDAWPQAADRVVDLMNVVKSGNFDLKKPIHLANYGVTVTGKENPLHSIEECKIFVQKK